MPEIGPEPVIIGGKTPSIPSTSPLLVGIGKLAKEIEFRSITLLHAAEKQKQANLDTLALIDYKNKITALDTDIVGIKDTKTKLQLFETGIDQIQNDLREQYPGLSNEAFKSIQLEITNDRKQHQLKTIADGVAQGKKDLTANLDLLSHLAATAKSNQEAKLIEGNALKSIDDSVNNGIHSLDEARDLKFKFLYKEKLSQFDNLTETNPLAVLSIPYEKSGLTGKDYIEKQKKANDILLYNESETFRNFTLKKRQAMEQATPENVQDLYDKGLVSKDYTTYVLGHKPSESDEVLANHYMGELEPTTTEEEASSVYRQALANGITGTGKAILTNRYHEKLNELKTEHGEISQELWNDIKDQIDNTDPTIGQPMMENFTGNRMFNAQLLRKARLSLKYAKDVNEMHGIHDALIKQIEQRYSAKKGLSTAIVSEGTEEPKATEEFNK